MPKKNPNTATGDKRKRTTGDSQHKEDEQVYLETQEEEESRRKRKTTNVLPISTISSQTSPQASTSNQCPDRGRFINCFD